MQNREGSAPGPETPSVGTVVDHTRSSAATGMKSIGEDEFEELAEDAFGVGDGRAGRGTLGGKRERDDGA